MHLTPPPTRRPRWAAVLLGLGIVWLAGVACSYATGYTATVTVTQRLDDGFCVVTWLDPAGTTVTSDGADCDHDPPGTRLEERVSGWPAPGTPSYDGTYVAVGLLFGLPPTVIAGAVLLVAGRTARDRVTFAHDATPPARTGGDDAALAAPRTVAALRRRHRVAWLTLLAGLVSAGVLVCLGIAGTAADEDLRAAAVVTEGTVQSVEPDTRTSSGSADVRFTVDRHVVVRSIDLGGYADDYAPGQRVQVVYDPADPRRATLDAVPYEPGWMGLPIVVSVAGSVALLPLGSLLVAARRRTRRLLAAGVWTPVRARVVAGDERLVFTTPGGVVWQTRVDTGWPTLDREPRALSGWGLPDEDPATVPYDQAAWWVSDGAYAVFSPDQGAPLVLARRRR